MNFALSFFAVIVITTFSFGVNEGQDEVSSSHQELQKNVFRIGFEVEFPDLGASLKKDDNSEYEPVPENKAIMQPKDGSWLLIPDTVDAKLGREQIFFVNNLEFKTGRDGFSVGENKVAKCATEIVDVIEKIKLHNFSALDNILTKNSVEIAKLDPAKIASLGENKYVFPLLQENSKLSLNFVKKIGKKGSDSFDKMRLQVTTQLPLYYVPVIFRHLTILGVKRIKDFLKVPKVSDYVLDPEKWSPGGGLALLFNFYVANLFEDKTVLESEPGPKAKLSIMSRIAFYDMYGFLSVDEKRVFESFIEDYSGDAFRQKSFIRYALDPYDELINPKKVSYEELFISPYGWFLSMIRPCKVSLLPLLTEPNKKTDLLSPPSALGANYSMGAIRLMPEINSDCAVLELRSTSNVFEAAPLKHLPQIMEAEERFFAGIMNTKILNKENLLELELKLLEDIWWYFDPDHEAKLGKVKLACKWLSGDNENQPKSN